jgi:ESCRT-I complex subunit VPS28
VFDITTKIISALDIVSMGIASVDQLTPYVRDILTALNNYPNLPATFSGTQTIRKQIDILAQKQATDDLSENELRQLKFDIENVMNQFNELLGAR